MLMIRFPRPVRMAAIAAAVLPSLLPATGARAGSPAPLHEATSPSWVFITLGTNAGAIPSAARRQPSNVLSLGELHILIDAGDGAGTQLAAAGISLRQVHHVLISHLHMDHIGGLFALLGQRAQIAETRPLKIFGPPGTKQLVDLLCDSTRSAIGATDLAFYGTTPCANVIVTELRGGTRFPIENITITAASNTHYSASGNSAGAISLSFRFDTPTRSIVYTGDTGPSSSIEQLARGADLLVTEVIEPERELATVVAKLENPNAELKQRIDAHFRLDHLSPSQAASLAKQAGVARLVLTHVALNDAEIIEAHKIISATFSGEVAFARDMDRF